MHFLLPLPSHVPPHLCPMPHQLRERVCSQQCSESLCVVTPPGDLWVPPWDRSPWPSSPLHPNPGRTLLLVCCCPTHCASSTPITSQAQQPHTSQTTHTLLIDLTSLLTHTRHPCSWRTGADGCLDGLHHPGKTGPLSWLALPCFTFLVAFES